MYKKTFFGRRKGRPLRKNQRARLERLMPILSLAPHLVKDQILVLPNIFTKTYDSYWLEIGFGAGEHLAKQAADNPHIGFIGCEPYINGVAHFLGHVERANLQNVRLFTDDVHDLFAYLPQGQINRVFILFPDPWPKKRHRARRLILPQFLTSLAYVLKDQAIIRISTDHGDYLRWILFYMQAFGSFEWCNPEPVACSHRPEDWPETRYARKALAGRPHYLTFCYHAGYHHGTEKPGQMLAHPPYIFE